MCAFRQAGAGGRADYVDGDSYPSVVAVHASFGNMLGGFVVMELVKAVVPFLVPIPLSFYFDIFDGLLQAYVFVFLTALFMNEEME